MMAESLAALSPTPHPSLHTSRTGLWVLSINCDTFCADGTVILFQGGISSVQDMSLLTQQSNNYHITAV